VHGGAKDLIFPHHEAEIALMEAYSGKKPFVKYWIHTGFLNVEGQKMSKSRGNFITIRDALTKWDKDTLRFMFVSTHYSSGLDYSERSLMQARANLERIRTAYAGLKGAKKGSLGKKYLEEFESAMNDNFNTPKVVALLIEMARMANKEKDGSLRATFDEIGKILGVSFKPRIVKLKPEDQKLKEKYDKARAEKRFDVSDKIRKEVLARGFRINDLPGGKGSEWIPNY